MNGEENFKWAELRNSGIESKNKNLAIGQFYENGNHVKYQVTDLNDEFAKITELENDGELTDIVRRIPRITFIELIINKHFEQSRVARREGYTDLKKYDVGSLYKR
jgi:hypothetical protein